MLSLLGEKKTEPVPCLDIVHKNPSLESLVFHQLLLESTLLRREQNVASMETWTGGGARRGLDFQSLFKDKRVGGRGYPGTFERHILSF